MHHIVYLTTNNINGRIYVGKHSTKNLKDNYKGSGSELKDEFKEYGKSNFTTEILKLCKSSQEAFDLEKKLVTFDFINKRKTINRQTGGNGTTIKSITQQLREMFNDIDKIRTCNRRRFLKLKIYEIIVYEDMNAVLCNTPIGKLYSRKRPSRKNKLRYGKLVPIHKIMIDNKIKFADLLDSHRIK